MAIWITINLCVAVLAIILTFLFFHIRRNKSFWATRGVPFVKPHLLFGSFIGSASGKYPMTDDIVNLYNSFKGKRFAGVWQMFSPVLFPVDPDLVRDILIKDFASWQYRGWVINEDVDPLATHLAFLDGKKWKAVRAKLTPVFTSAKLKNMHYLLQECARDFSKYIDTVADKGEPIDVMDMSPRFSIDIIGSCVFGIQMNSMTNEDAVFRKMGNELFTVTLSKQVIHYLQTGFPALFRFLKLSTTPRNIEKFFLDLTKETFEYREKNNVRRHDLLDLLRDLKTPEGTTVADDDIEFDYKLLAAQAFIFFGAGLDTSSKTIAFCLHELAVNPDIQDRLRKEIHETKASSNGEFTWDGLKNMKYLTMVVQETLRKYPIAPHIQRVSSKPYQIPDTKVELPAGTHCMIPIYAIHHDPEYYPEPEKFIPERFTEEEINKRPATTYLPFGGGPRTCIGMRFAEQGTKMALVTVLDKFKVSLCEKSQNPMKFAIKSPTLLASERGVWLKISRL